MKNLITLILILLVSTPIFSQNADCKCCTEKHAEFDFWTGNWNVTNPDGTTAGTNNIDKIQDNCILRENWTSAKGKYTGTSNNFYNAKTKQWEQIWVDNQGGSLHLKGNRTGNQMILETDEETNKDGQIFYHRVTWTHNEDGSVRQYWETITGGKDITVAFDGLYRKAQ
jgi:hypothetical protein